MQSRSGCGSPFELEHACLGSVLLLLFSIVLAQERVCILWFVLAYITICQLARNYKGSFTISTNRDCPSVELSGWKILSMKSRLLDLIVRRQITSYGLSSFPT